MYKSSPSPFEVCPPAATGVAIESATGAPGDRTLISTLKQAGLREATMQYLVVIEKGSTSYGAYVPDLPGCVAVGETEAEVRKLIREAIPFHITGLRSNGDPVPDSSRVEYVDVDATPVAA
jgi:predicted RNase H-like HicB family nuclease